MSRRAQRNGSDRKDSRETAGVKRLRLCVEWIWRPRCSQSRPFVRPDGVARLGVAVSSRAVTMRLSGQSLCLGVVVMVMVGRRL